MINIGDKVEVIHPKQTYCFYRDWLDKNVKEKKLKEKWNFTVSPIKNRRYIVLKKAKHEFLPNILYYIQDEKTKKCYIVDEKGIQLAKNKDLEIKIGDKVKLKNRRGERWNVCGKMDKYIGKIVTVSRTGLGIGGEAFTIVEDDSIENFKWLFRLEDIEYVVKQKHFKSLPNNYTGTIEVENGFIKEILDETEKRYLKAVIRPFKDKIIYISKEIDFGREYYIYIDLDDDSICLPNFKKGTMYNGMEEDEKYTLKELGLDE